MKRQAVIRTQEDLFVDISQDDTLLFFYLSDILSVCDGH